MRSRPSRSVLSAAASGSLASAAAFLPEASEAPVGETPDGDAPYGDPTKLTVRELRVFGRSHGIKFKRTDRRDDMVRAALVWIRNNPISAPASDAVADA